MVGIKLPVSIRTMRHTTQTEDIYYPNVYGMRDLMVQQQINQSIFDLMISIVSELRHPDFRTIITGSYEIKTNEKDILAITLTCLGDFRGAHPMTIIKAINIDINTGRVYNLKDLFKPNSNYIKVLSDIISEQLKERDIPLLGEFEGIRPDQDFYIADINLVIFFQLYEIAPYAAGFQYFSIPIYDIVDMTPEDGILQRMIMI